MKKIEKELTRVKSFFLGLEPPTKTFQDKVIRKSKNGKVIIHDSSDLQKIKATLRDHLAGHIPDEKIQGPIRLVVKWLYPKREEHTDGQWKDTKPDIDNMQKALFDIMTVLGFWEDDSQVVSLIAEKFWAEIPGIYVEIWKV